MTSRMIRSHGGAQVLKDCLISLFAIELLKPSKEIYLISPWVSNSPLLDNRHGAFDCLFPQISSSVIRLADVLETMADQGSRVRLICDLQDENTRRFRDQLGSRTRINFRQLYNNHEKGLFTDHLYLHGSMNFTFRGIHINGECIRITTSPSYVKQAMLSARARWEEALSC